jgi:dTDP-glucose 4,6-dehydratase
VVTGGAGFLGSHLCDALLARGDHVICIDNFATGSEANISRLISNPKFSLLRQDVIDRVVIDGPIDRIMHFASPASPTDYLRLPIETLKTGSLGTLNLLDLARATSARFFLASTSEIYGDPKLHPQSEDYWGNVNPIGERSVYDESKRFAEAATMAYNRAHGLDIRIVRIFNTYGPRMSVFDGRVVSNFIVQALRNKPITVYGDGRQSRSFCYVDDEIRGILAVLESDYVGPINVGNSTEYTINRLAELVLEITGSSSQIVGGPLPVDDPVRRMPDLSLAVKLLGWKPEVDISTGIRRTAEWFRALLAL